MPHDPTIGRTPPGAPVSNVRRIMQRQWERAMTAALPKLEQISVTAPDGVTIAAQAWGNPAGPEILFIHGYSQCHLAWRRQMTDAALSGEFRCVSYDLRGHGASGKPEEARFYANDQLWADDLAAVMEATGLKRPVLAAWSYGGRVVADYLTAYGQSRIAGINYVAALTNTQRRFWGPDLRYTVEMASPDMATALRASRKFVHACFAGRPAGDELELTLSYVMLAPAPVRRLVLGRTRNDGEILPRITIPVLVTHGGMDRIVLPSMGQYTAASIPGAQLALYGGVGHSPFYEDSERFNRELAAFVGLAN